MMPPENEAFLGRIGRGRAGIGKAGSEEEEQKNAFKEENKVTFLPQISQMHADEKRQKSTENCTKYANSRKRPGAAELDCDKFQIIQRRRRGTKSISMVCER